MRIGFGCWTRRLWVNPTQIPFRGTKRHPFNGVLTHSQYGYERGGWGGGGFKNGDFGTAIPWMGGLSRMFIVTPGRTQMELLGARADTSCPGQRKNCQVRTATKNVFGLGFDEVFKHLAPRKKQADSRTSHVSRTSIEFEASQPAKRAAALW